jgi:glutathione S-transferase
MLELHHNNISVCAQKVRIVLAEKNLPWTGRHVSLAKGEQLTPEFKKLNPRGVVPVLVHDGSTIVESSVICSYLDDVFPDPPLSPGHPWSARRCGCGASCRTISCTWPAGR